MDGGAKTSVRPARPKADTLPAVGYARRTILEALDLLEQENDEIRTLNSKILSELEWLRQENEQLRKDLEAAKAQRYTAEQRLDLVDADNAKMKAEMKRQAEAVAEKLRHHKEAENLLKADNVKLQQAIEDVGNLLSNREDDMTKLSKELRTTRDQLERNSRRLRTASDQDIELLHEIEMLKTEKADITNEKHETERVNTKLRNELRNLETQLDEKSQELKNENRRHSVLTKEFNSMLEENSHLKLQLRRRVPPAASGGSGGKDSNVTSEGIVPLNIPANSPTPAPRNKPRPCLQPTREKSTLVGLSADFMRQTLKGSQRSREASLAAGDSSTVYSDELSRYGGTNRSSVDTQSRTTRQEDSPSPDTLPALVDSSKKWRP